jgi:hypothetical protein
MDPSNTSRSGEQDTRTDVEPGPATVAADRPVVDGTSTSSQELRDEVEQLRAADPQRVEELRAEVAATAEELAARVDVPARLRASKQQAADRLRVVAERTREQPVALAGAAVLLVLVVVLRRRRAGRRSRAT